MELTITLSAMFILVVLCIAWDIYRTRHCKVCGTKMNRYYDVEEDAEVYQCPKCGQSYLIK